MRNHEFIQIILFIGLLVLLSPLLGRYMATVFEGKPTWLSPVFGPIERFLYLASGINRNEEMSWMKYLWALVAFNIAGCVLTIIQMMTQSWLPLNPQHLPNVPFALALNTAVSFMTNTNWQAYSGEATMSYLTQMSGLAVHNFTSAATGIAVFLALTRGLVRRQSSTLGNFWVDLVRSTLYVLLPLSLMMSLLLVSQGVVQNFRPYDTAKVTAPWTTQVPKLDAAGQPVKDAQGNAVTETQTVTEQIIPQGPVASQVAIKQLGSNGGGYFGQNSAHPFENPTPFSNLLEMFAILLIPSSLVFSFGYLVGNVRQGIAIWATMAILFAVFFAISWHAEVQPNPVTTLTASMEGKEQRFGVMNSVLWAVSTTGTSNGSVNAMHDSLSPIAGLMTLLNLQLGCVVFGGDGAGMYGMLMYVILTVFLAGLMVGRTPEYLGKKIEAPEIRWAVVAVIVPSSLILVGSAIASVTPSGLLGLGNNGPHGLSEILYAFSSCAANNGSAFGGLSVNTNFYNYLLSLVMFLGRFVVIIPCLAIAGSMAAKKIAPASSGTFPTTGPIFIGLLISVLLIVVALTFFPVLCLGPIVEQLLMNAGRSF
jgi:K+-transporting ATPase ATPase A chain